MSFNIKNALPIFLILIFLLVIIPQSFAADDLAIGDLSSDLNIGDAISDDIDLNSDDSSNVNDELNEKSADGKIVKSGDYDYETTPNPSSVTYNANESKIITVTADFDYDRSESIEGNSYYVWINGENDANKVEIYNVFADAEEFTFDLKTISDKMENGYNILTFHPDVNLLSANSMGNYKFNQLLVNCNYTNPTPIDDTNDTENGTDNGTGDNNDTNGTGGDDGNDTIVYSYVSTPEVSSIDYIIGESRIVKINIDYDVTLANQMEYNPFYVWVNGQNSSNAVSLTNVDASVTILNFDLLSVSDKLIEGQNFLTFHPSIDLLNSLSIGNQTFNTLFVRASKPVVLDSLINIEDVSDDGNISISLKDSNSKAIANATVKILINGSSAGSVKTDSNGKASFNINQTGLMDLSLVYDGNISSNASNYTSKLIVSSQVEERIVVVNNTVEVPVDVIHVVNNTVEVPVEVIHVVNNTVEVPVYITPNKTATSILFKNMTTNTIEVGVDGRNGEYFYFTLVDSDGKALAGKNVSVGFNGHVYSYITDSKGQAKVQVNLPIKGGYTFAICFLGDDDYNASFAVARITVNLQKTKISADKKTYKASAKTKTISVTLKSAKGNPLKGKKVSVVLNGKTYTASTNAKGVATVKVSLTKKGTYSFTAKFAGTDRYAAVSVKNTLKLS